MLGLKYDFWSKAMPRGNYALLYSGLLQAIPFNVWPCEVTPLKSRQSFECLSNVINTLLSVDLCQPQQL